MLLEVVVVSPFPFVTASRGIGKTAIGAYLFSSNPSWLPVLSSVPISLRTRPLLGGVGGGTARLLILPPTIGRPTLPLAEAGVMPGFRAGSAGGGDGHSEGGRGRGGFRFDC